jgi:hypothetical protein
VSAGSGPSESGKDGNEGERRVTMYIGIGLGTLILIIVLIALLT